MKCLMLVLVVFIHLPLGLEASEVKNSEGDPTREISRLSYFVHKNLFELSSHLLTPIENSSDSVATKARVRVETSSSTSSTTFDSTLAYGLTDWLRLSTAQGMLLTSGTFTNLPPSTSYGEVYSQGPTDPVFAIASRFLNFRGIGLSADISLLVSPETGDHFLGKPGQLGDARRGSSTTSVLLPIYFIQRSNDLELLLIVANNSEGSATGNSSANSYTKSNTQVYSLSIYDRLHFSSLFLQAGVDVSLPYTSQQTTQSNPQVIRTFNYPTIINQKYVAGFQLNPRLVIETEVNSNAFSIQSSADDGVLTTTDQKTTNISLKLHVEI